MISYSTLLAVREQKSLALTVNEGVPEHRCMEIPKSGRVEVVKKLFARNQKLKTEVPMFKKKMIGKLSRKNYQY